MDRNHPARPETLAAQALGRVDPGTGALVPPLHPATTFLRNPDNSYPDGRGYTRADNPTYDLPEELLARLEGGKSAMLFASGMAAATAPFACLAPGDHVIVPRVMYWGVRKWLAQFGITWGLEVSLVDTTDVDEVRAALRPGRTRLVWLESPSNPTWEISDIAAICEVAHAAHARVAVDSTVATPVLLRPIELGADLVMHSATKYLNGHSDVLAGALVTAKDDPFWARLRSWRNQQGAVLGTFEAWLLLRGMRTLFVRVRQQTATAQRLAEWLATHPAVDEVLYPGLTSHPGHALAATQFSGGFGAMLSIRVKGGEAAAIAVAAAVQVFGRATSLGGTESLVEHRSSVEGPSTPVPADLLRLSIGLEDVDDLLADLDQAFAAAAPFTDGVLARRAVPEQDRAMVIARGGDLLDDGGEGGDGVDGPRPVGSPGAWLPMGYRSAGAVPDSAGGTLVERVSAVLDHAVNPAVSAHGGRIELDGIGDDGVVRIRLAGGCQGCSLAEVTVFEGVRPLLVALDGVAGVADVTDHAAGTAPYLKPAKR